MVCESWTQTILVNCSLGIEGEKLDLEKKDTGLQTHRLESCMEE